MHVAAAIMVRAAMHRPDGKPTPARLASSLIDLYEALRKLAGVMGAYDADPASVRRTWDEAARSR